jgi:hypothetical protein
VSGSIPVRDKDYSLHYPDQTNSGVELACRPMHAGYFAQRYGERSQKLMNHAHPVPSLWVT